VPAKAAPLCDGGDVGALVAQDLFEDITQRRGIVGDDEHSVLDAAASRADVETAMSRRFGDDDDADVDSFALVAMSGGGISEPDGLADVLGR